MLVVLSLGSNLGDKVANLNFARSEIGLKVGQVVATSSLYQTEPISDVEQDDFLNAVLIVKTDLNPTEVLHQIQELELSAGRTRELHWGPRTLDIDIIDIEGFTSDSSALTVPHPRARERAFVLVPLLEIAPDWLLGGIESVTELACSLNSQRIQKLPTQFSGIDA